MITLAQSPGQMSTDSNDNARILALRQPGAPATICERLSALTPSSSARSMPWSSLEMNAMSCPEAVGRGVRFTRGPAPEECSAGQPGQRSEGLGTRHRGQVYPGQRALWSPPSRCRNQSRSIAMRRRLGGSSGKPFAGKAAAPSGSDSATSGCLVDAIRQLRRSAADVQVDDAARAPAVTSAAPPGTSTGTRCCPEHLQSHRFGLHPGERTSSGWSRRAPPKVAKAIKSAHPNSGDLGEFVHRLDQLVGPRRVQLPDARWIRPAAALTVELIGVG